MCKCQVYAPGFDFNNFKNTPVYDLAKAVESDDTVKISKILLIDKKNIDFKDPKFGLSLLTLALINNKNNSVKKLLSSGANPNLISPVDNTTPFLSVCETYYDLNNGPAILSLLIQYGADVNSVQVTEVKNSAGQPYIYRMTALEFLCSSGTLEAVKILVDNGADLNVYPKNGFESLITQANFNSQLDILKYFLIEKKVPIPDYCVLRNEGTPDEEKITLTQLLNERMLKMDEHQLQIKQEILDFLKDNGKE